MVKKAKKKVAKKRVAKKKGKKKVTKKKTSGKKREVDVRKEVSMDETNTHDAEQKAYEERLRRRLKQLRRAFEEGNIRIPDDPHITESLLAVRNGPDGEIDLNSVNGLVRSMALAVTFMEDRKELKKAFPLDEIQHKYFEAIEDNFGEFYKKMIEQELTPHEAGVALSQRKEVIKSITDPIPEFIEAIEGFWHQAGEAVFAHVEDTHDTLKGVFGGDLFPSQNENIASKCGIYTDTIILPDPFLRSKEIFSRSPEKDQAYYFIKHALNILQYKELACAEVETPIVVIAPDKGVLEERERDYYIKLGKEDALSHAKKLFGRDFESFEELMGFATTLDSIEKVVAELKDKSRLLFDTEWEGSISEQIQFAIEKDSEKVRLTNHPGILVAGHAMGRMCICNELLIRSRRLGGTPIIDVPTSWKYFNWKLEYDADKAEIERNLKNLHVLRGLQSLAENKMQWLGKVPVKALIEIRKTGALAEIREVLGKGVMELAQAKPTNFHQTADQVFDNIEHAFVDHKEKIKKLSKKKWKFAGTDIGSWLAVGTLEVTAAATGLPVWGLATIAANQVFDFPKLKDIPASIKELAEESRKLKQSPVGMLFTYAKK